MLLPKTSPIESALERLWHRSRFASYFFQAVQFRREDSIPTLALIVEQSRTSLLYNETFSASIPSEELIGLLIHEMLHVVLSHNHRAFPQEDLQLQNIAQDMTVNSYIQSHSRHFFSRRGDYEADIPPLILPPSLPVIPNAFFCETGIKDPSWEEVYRWMKAQPKDTLTSLFQTTSGESDDGIEINLSSALQQALRDSHHLQADTIPAQKFSFGTAQGMAFIDRDDEFMPTGVHIFHDQRDLRSLNSQRDRIIALASQDDECRKERSCEMIRGILHHTAEVDIASWKRQLRSIIDYSSQSSEWTYTYGRFNRRFLAAELFSPGRIFKEQEIITIAVDVSASMIMRPSYLQEAFGVVEELLGKYRIHLVCIDEDLFVPQKDTDSFTRSKNATTPYVYRAGDWKFLRTGSSGTTFFAPLFNSYMKGHRELLIVITDGEIYDLHLLKKYSPTVWVLPQETSAHFEAPFGRTLRIRTTT